MEITTYFGIICLKWFMTEKSILAECPNEKGLVYLNEAKGCEGKIVLCRL